MASQQKGNQYVTFTRFTMTIFPAKNFGYKVTFAVKDGPVEFSETVLTVEEAKDEALALFVRNALGRNYHFEKDIL